MANQTRSEALILEVDHDNDEEDKLEKLESDVNQMAQKILEFRTTLPDQLKNALASTLSAQRPLFLPHLPDCSDPGPSGNPNSDSGLSHSGKRPPLAEEDQETAEKIWLLREKLSSNVSALPVLLERMKECISRIDHLESCNGFVHPAFKRKRTS
ncbi:hypothetical protein U1Q18_023574 [Sarracenia purpurea var. burkii]